MGEAPGQVIEVLMDLIRLRMAAPSCENYLDAITYLDRPLSGRGLDTRVIEVPRSVIREYYLEYVDYPRYILPAELCNSRGPRR